MTGEAEGQKKNMLIAIATAAVLIVALYLIVVIVIPYFYGDKDCNSPYTTSTCISAPLTVDCSGNSITILYRGGEDASALTNLSIKVDDMQPLFMNVTAGSQIFIVPKSTGTVEGHHLLIVSERANGLLMVERDRMVKCP
jgi:hypothetical protein